MTKYKRGCFFMQHRVYRLTRMCVICVCLPFLFASFFSYFTVTYLLLSRIGPLRFQAGRCRRWPNLVFSLFVFVVFLCSCCIADCVIIDNLKLRYARFQLECPMPIALRAPSREYISRLALHLEFVPSRVLEWNMWKSIARSSCLLQRGPASTGHCAVRPADCLTVQSHDRKLE